MTIDLGRFALEIARRGSIESMVPVIEKELVHYDIIRALDESKWLDRLTFQGGTCLRLCYGAVRYSEDLDFTTADDLANTDLVGFRDLLVKALQEKYSVVARVKEPRKIHSFEGGGTMKRWQVVVDTAPARPDLPSQKIKIEIAHVSSYTREMRLLQENYPELEGMYARAVVGCQSLDEILADKIVSFSRQVRIPRYRDLWDIPWIVGQQGRDMSAVAEMVSRKIDDYGTEVAADALLLSGEERARNLVMSETFASEMRRFLPGGVMEDTLARPVYREAMRHRIADVFAQTASLIKG